MHPSIRRPSPALVIACLALGVSLSGAGYAAGVLPKNSVGTAQLKNGAVTAAKIKNGAIGPTKLTPAARRPGPVGPAGPKGDTGPQGAAGPAGAQGAPGVSGWEVVVVGGVLLANQISGGVEATCPAGKKLLGGGVATFNKEIQILTSTPLGDTAGGRWIVSVTTFDGQPVGVDSSVNVRIVCATVT